MFFKIAELRIKSDGQGFLQFGKNLTNIVHIHQTDRHKGRQMYGRTNRQKDGRFAFNCFLVSRTHQWMDPPMDPGFWLHHLLGDFFLNLVTGFMNFLLSRHNEFFLSTIGHFFAQHYVTFPILRILLCIYVRARENKKGLLINTIQGLIIL